MNCATCLQSKPIPLCVSAIVIGEIDSINTDVVVKIKNESTGRIEQVNATSDNDGIVTADVSSFEFMENHYTLSIHKVDDYSDEYDITIDGEQSKCIDICFEHCNESVDEVTLKLVD